MKKNVLIVNFNTQKLTEACIRSVNKFTPGCKIYVFDNSNKTPFINSFDNVEAIDNTKGWIINFNEWLEKYPNRNKSGGKTNEWGSAKHAYTIEKCMQTIKENFVLLDSDVLIKRDISPLFKNDVIYVAETVLQPKSKIHRVLPYICFINTEMCLKNDIHYFNDDYMHGLRKTAKGDGYDTGAYFYLVCEKFKHSDIKCDEYIEHYKAGSWTPAADKARNTKHTSVDEWLEINKKYWDDSPVEQPQPTPEKEKEYAPSSKVSPTYTEEEPVVRKRITNLVKRRPEPPEPIQPRTIMRLSKTRIEMMEREEEEQTEEKKQKKSPINLEQLKKDRIKWKRQ